MKKYFEEPTVDVTELYVADVITTSDTGSPDWSDSSDEEWGL